MRFLADMGISPVTVAFLVAHGHDAVHAGKLGFAEHPDHEILAFARRDQRILLTHDLDFPHLMAASGADQPSVVVFRLRSMKPENVNLHLEAVIQMHAASLQQGVIISITDSQARIRLLPIDLGLGE